MELSFLSLPEKERRLYIEQAALRRNVSPLILEQDFWVCWLLAILFSNGRLGFSAVRGRIITMQNPVRFGLCLPIRASPRFAMITWR
jgi:hypothetical protein